MTETGESPTGVRVLLIDDTPANLVLLEQILAVAGLTDVTSIQRPAEAVAAFEADGADIVLVDLHMPEMDGYQVMAAIRDRVGADDFVPIVVLTADTTPDTRDRALSAGADDFLTKPFDVTEVVLRVKNLLRARALHVRLHTDKRNLEAQVRGHETERRELALARQVRRARIQRVLDDNGPTMVFQPIVDLAGGRIAGVEALSRFDVSSDGTPARCFAEATDLGLGTDLELAAISRALDQFGQLPDGAYLSLNVSPDVVLSGRLDERLGAFPPERLVLELTEHERVDDYAALLGPLLPLRAQGLRIAVDDAGSGFASLQHILKLQPDIIKLDLALTQQVDSDPARRSLAKALVSFGQEIDARIVAEGVETAAELATLRELGVGYAQGYHLGRPGHLEALRSSGDLPGALEQPASRAARTH